MSIFKHLDYREALLQKIENRKALGKLTLAKLAEKVGLQPSYLTHVLKGRADFNSDQLYAVCEMLNCTEGETDYLILLLEYARSTIPARKEKLKKRIDASQAHELKTTQHISAPSVTDLTDENIRYYLDPLCQLIHVFLNFESFAKNPHALSAKLGLSVSQIDDVLKRLVEARYIEETESGYVVIGKNRHLPKESPLCTPHQYLMRYKSIDQMQRLKQDQTVSFSATFSSTPEDKTAIHRAFLEFISKTETIVKNTERKHVYQMNFDLFPWALD